MPVNQELVRRLLLYLEKMISGMKRSGLTRKKLLDDEDLRLATERRLQTAIEACIDIAFHIIAGENLGIVEHNKDAILLLGQKGVISKSLANRVAAATDMRNVLVHGYGKIDFDLFYKAILEDVIDLEEFIKKITLHIS